VAGTTLLEVMIVLSILVFVVSVFHGMILANQGLRETNRQNAIAAEAARVIVEEMRSQDFRQVYALYDSDPSNDPGGAGTAPGSRFAVSGLRPLASSPDGLQGEVVFPSKLVVVPQTNATAQEVGTGGTTTTTTTEWRLLETYEDEGLGMPRDLNGDSIIDDLDHSQDYIILPVRVRVEWQGNHGSRSLEISTMLVDFEVGK